MLNTGSKSTQHRRHAIGIGAQKAASTWVFDLLRLHRDVEVPPEKELDFFSHRYDRGHAWYRSQFRGSGLAFEASPSYLPDPLAAARARAFDPDLRIVVTLRDPVARAYSQHLHEVAKGHIPPIGFADALTDNPSYLEQGFYAKHLSAWFSHFPRDQVLVLFAEDIRRDPAKAAARIHDFLALSPGPVLSEHRNVSDRARVRGLRTTLRAGGNLVRRLGGETLLVRAKALPGVRDVLAWNSQPLRAVIPPLSPDERSSLARHFAEDARALRDLLGLRELPWDDGAHAPVPSRLSPTAPGLPRRPIGRRSASAVRG